MLKSRADKAPRGTNPRHPKWNAPPEGLDKINVDTMVSKTSIHGDVGVVCRSRDDMFLGASTMIVPGISDPATLEAMGCREALAPATDLNLQCFVIASDCLQVINNLKDTYEGSYSMITSEIKARSREFIDVRFKHENRASNGEAHRVARSFISNTAGRQVWLLQPLYVPVSL
jgi:hypothetical protein